MVLVKLPLPVPLLVFESAVVGFCSLLQHNPFAVIAAPPSLLIIPPQLAELEVSNDKGPVLIDGIEGKVIKLICAP